MAEQDRPTPKTKLAKISGADKKPIPSKGVKGVPIKAIKKDKTWDRLMKKRKNPDENYDDFKGGVINDFIQWMLGEETRDKINKRKQIEAKRLAAEKAKKDKEKRMWEKYGETWSHKEQKFLPTLKSGGKVRKKKSGGKVYTNQNKRYANGGKVSGRKATYK